MSAVNNSNLLMENNFILKQGWKQEESIYKQFYWNEICTYLTALTHVTNLHSDTPFVMCEDFGL